MTLLEPRPELELGLELVVEAALLVVPELPLLVVPVLLFGALAPVCALVALRVVLFDSLWPVDVAVIAPVCALVALKVVLFGSLWSVDVAVGPGVEFAAPLSLVDPVATPAIAETTAVDVLVGCGLSSTALQENMTDLAL